MKTTNQSLYSDLPIIKKEGRKMKSGPSFLHLMVVPLSASFWLHFGVLGPKRIVINDPDYTKPAPYKVVNNEFSILDKADLVMIDPIGVGFSKPIGESKWEDFWGVDQDVRSVGLFHRTVHYSLRKVQCTKISARRKLRYV